MLVGWNLGKITRKNFSKLSKCCIIFQGIDNIWIKKHCRFDKQSPNLPIISPQHFVLYSTYCLTQSALIRIGK